MYKLEVRIFAEGFKTEDEKIFDSFEDAMYYFENRMFTGEQPNLLVMEHPEEGVFTAAGSHGKLLVALRIEKCDPPKEIG